MVYWTKDEVPDIGGIGIKLTKEIFEEIFKRGLFCAEDFKTKPHECMDILSDQIACSMYFYDSFYENYICLLVSGDTLGEINTNAQLFCRDLNKIGISITPDQLGMFN